jgi:CBS domain-containing membrane protein
MRPFFGRSEPSVMTSQLSRLRQLAALIGVEHDLTSHPEKWIAALGALLSITAVAFVSFSVVDGGGAGLIIASMGASAVLLFVVPHGALSQPWPLVGAHVLSALVGVACREWVPVPWLAAAVAVSLSIVLMQYLRCVHPPGGATALVAVIGGTQIEALGYGYVLQPVLVNVSAMLLVALVFNNLFPWRRYPALLMRRKQPDAIARAERHLELTQEDFEAAMRTLNTFVDISTEDLVELVDRARQHAEQQRPHPASIQAGRCYSNGRLGRHWCVRQVLDQDQSSKPGRRVIYKTMAGEGAWDTGICGYEEFRQWARFEVTAQQGRWIRLPGEEPSAAA